MMGTIGWAVLWLPGVILCIFLLATRKNVPRGSGGVPMLGKLSEKFKHISSAPAMLAAYYHQHKGRTLRYTTLRGRRQVVVTSDEAKQELRAQPETVLSFTEWMKEVTSVELFMPVYWNDTHALRHRTVLAFFRGPLSRNLDEYMPLIYAETTAALEQVLSAESPTAGAITVNATELVRASIGSVGTRMALGPSLCRNQEFIKILNQVLYKMGVSGFLVSIFPKFLRLFVADFMGMKSRKAALRSYIAPLIENRTVELKAQADGNEAGTLPKNPDNVLDELLKLSITKKKFTTEELLETICIFFFAMMHATTITTATALVEIAARPEYQAPLREEVQRCVDAADGWNLRAADQMLRLDSFIKESSRHHPTTMIAINRIAQREFTFSDGTTVVPGEHVCGLPEQRLEPTLAGFDGFRYSKLREEADVKDRESNSFTDVNDVSYMIFGSGIHACPGRFFATAVGKMVLARLLLDYDIAIVGARQPVLSFEEAIRPQMDVKITLKKR